MAQGKNRFGGIVFGPALVVAGVLVLWQNEGRFNYFEAAEQATVITSPRELEREPVAYTGSFATDITLEGDLVDRFVGYFHVIRRTEIYSWREEEDDGHTTWDKGWYSYLESNSRNNDLEQQLHDDWLYPEGYYRVDNLDINIDDIHFVDDQQVVPLDQLKLTGQGRRAGLERRGRYFYLAKGSAYPTLGDERVSYYGLVAEPTMTYFGQIRFGRADAYQAMVTGGFINAIIGNDGILHHLVTGDRAAALKKIESDFQRTVWMVRIGGTVAIVMGIYTFFSVFTSLLYQIPLLGSIVETGVFLVALAIGLPIALLTIAGGVLINNPLTLALPLALVVGALIYFLRRRGQNRQNAERVLTSELSAARRQVPPEAVTSGLVDSANNAAAPPAAGPDTTAKPPPERSEGATYTPRRTTSSAARVSDETAAKTHADVDMAVLESTFAHLTRMATVEGEFDKREKQFLVNWGRQQGIENERMQALFSHTGSDNDDTTQFNETDLELLVCMAMADGVVTRQEWQLLNRLASQLGKSQTELKQLLRAVEDGTLTPASA